MNNIRDMENDAVCGKRTLPVKLGLKGAKRYHYVIMTLAMSAMLLYTLMHPAGWSGYLFLLAYPLLLAHLGRVVRGQGKALDSELKRLSLATLLMSLLCGFGQILGN